MQSQPPPFTFKFLKDHTGTEHLAAYIRKLQSSWSISGKNSAVSIVRELSQMEWTGPQGTPESVASATLYIVKVDRHCIAHMVQPDDPTVILGVSGFHDSDFTTGRVEALQLALNALTQSP